ncbi:MAG: hypothetical protein ACFFD4_26405, partial [Candidatus Odinarchaeota archaeon]
MVNRDFFEEDKEVVKSFIEKNQYKLDVLVLEVMNTLLEMLDCFPEAVQKYDLEKLHDFMSEKAENLFTLFDTTGNQDLELQIIKEPAYMFRYVSVSIIHRSRTILYPLELVRIGNYNNFIPLLCNELERTITDRITLISLVDSIFELYRRCKVKLNKYNIKVIQKALNLVSSKKQHELFRYFRGLGQNKHFNRLTGLGVLCIYQTINFPVLGLVPYMHLAHHKTIIPDELQAFIEIENHPGIKQSYQVFRLFLLPKERETEWSKSLEELGITGKIDEWFTSYNWHSLKQTTRFTWKWNLNGFTDLNPYPTEFYHKFDLIRPIRIQKMTEIQANYLETVHQLESANSEDVAIIMKA